MNNFNYLLAAWMFVWVIFFGYEVSIARRMSALRKELEQLKQQLRNS